MLLLAASMACGEPRIPPAMLGSWQGDNGQNFGSPGIVQGMVQGLAIGLHVEIDENEIVVTQGLVPENSDIERARYSLIEVDGNRVVIASELRYTGGYVGQPGKSELTLLEDGRLRWRLNQSRATVLTLARASPASAPRAAGVQAAALEGLWIAERTHGVYDEAQRMMDLSVAGRVLEFKDRSVRLGDHGKPEGEPQPYTVQRIEGSSIHLSMLGFDVIAEIVTPDRMRFGSPADPYQVEYRRHTVAD